MINDSKNWEEGWSVVKNLRSGGKGHAKIVIRKEKADNKKYFLKILKEQNRMVSRKRMYREVTCYELLEHPSIPELIESNAAKWENKEYDLYLVAEFIEGDCLSDIDLPVSLPKAINIVSKLCETCEYIHHESVMHRDIKPNNIILRSNNADDVVLVDFGISHIESEEKVTPSDQEVGNRFLRLPELAIGSRLKDDPRSDVTLCAGIFYFLLTGSKPIQLIDQDSRMPHQRGEIKEILNEHDDLDVNQLFLCFDRAFDLHIDRRFQSAQDLAEHINKCLLSNKNKIAMDKNSRLERIKEKINTPSQEAIRLAMDKLKNVREIVLSVNRKILSQCSGGFEWTQGGCRFNPEKLEVSDTIGMISNVNANQKFAPRYHIVIAGNEIVLYANDNQLHRQDAEQVDFRDMENAIEMFVIEGIDEMLT